MQSKNIRRVSTLDLGFFGGGFHLSAFMKVLILVQALRLVLARLRQLSVGIGSFSAFHRDL
jgi:hypothetical protein